jgi:hypothetical protein
MLTYVERLVQQLMCKNLLPHRKPVDFMDV